MIQSEMSNTMKNKMNKIIRKVINFILPKKDVYVMTTVTTNGDFVKAFIDIYKNGVLKPMYQFQDKQKAYEAYEYLTCIDNE